MNEMLFTKLNELENDTELGQAIANVKSVPEMVELLASRNIHVTEDDIKALFQSTEELSEESLDFVAGGRGIPIGFFHGFSHGCGNETQYEKGGPFYSLGFWAGKMICHPFG